MTTPDHADLSSRDTDSPRHRALSRDLLAAAERVAQAASARERNARLAAAAAFAPAARDNTAGRPGDGDASRSASGPASRG